MVYKNSQTNCGNDKELCSEGVVVGVVGGPELEEDEVASGQYGEEEHHLHDSVVH